MTEEKFYKTNNEWIELINSKLDSDEFQHLCREILEENRFINVKPRGKGGDGRRDIEAELDSFIGKERIVKKCWAQCKNFNKKKALNYSSYATDVVQAQSSGIEEFLIMSNKDLSPDGKSDNEKWNGANNACKIRDWTGEIFLKYLFSAPYICKRFFPDEEVPPIVDKNNPKKAIKIMVKFGEQIGIEFNLQAEGSFNEKNPFEVGEYLKRILLNLSCDDSQKRIIYQKSSFIFLGLGMRSEAIFFLDKALDIDEENIETLLTKGYILEKLEETEDSNKVYDEILSINPDNIPALNNKGYNLYKQGKLDNALMCIDKCLEKDNSYIPAIKNKIDILLANRKIDDALKFLDENSFAFEKSIDLMSNKVNLLLEKLDLRNAFDLNEKILKLNKNNISALNNKGAIFERNSRYQKREKYSQLALETFDEVIKKDDKYPLGWSNKTVILINSFNLSEAEKIIEFAYSTFPESADVINKKGVLLLTKGEPKKSLRYFDSALKKRYRGEFLLNRAKAKLQISHYKESLNDANNLLNNEPKNSNAWIIKGQCLKKLRLPSWKKAFENADKFLEKPISLLEEDDETSSK